jgi:hypothetical protein
MFRNVVIRGAVQHRVCWESKILSFCDILLVFVYLFSVFILQIFPRGTPVSFTRSFASEPVSICLILYS